MWIQRVFQSQMQVVGVTDAQDIKQTLTRRLDELSNDFLQSEYVQLD
jgi:hypothetical protein